MGASAKFRFWHLAGVVVPALMTVPRGFWPAGTSATRTRWPRCARQYAWATVKPPRSWSSKTSTASWAPRRSSRPSPARSNAANRNGPSSSSWRPSSTCRASSKSSSSSLTTNSPIATNCRRSPASLFGRKAAPAFFQRTVCGDFLQERRSPRVCNARGTSGRSADWPR